MNQAQGAALEGLQKLRELGVPIERPEDYYAEMAKSDSHMQQVPPFLPFHPVLYLYLHLNSTYRTIQLPLITICHPVPLNG